MVRNIAFSIMLASFSGLASAQITCVDGGEEFIGEVENAWQCSVPYCQEQEQVQGRRFNCTAVFYYF